jgi:integrase
LPLCHGHFRHTWWPGVSRCFISPCRHGADTGEQSDLRRPPVLNAAALAVLEDLSRVRLGDYVIAGDRQDQPRRDLNRPWRQIVKHAGLADVTLHTLRHTTATAGVGAGIGLPLVGAILGHKVARTTARYAHIAADPARRASETIGATIAAALERRLSDNVVGIRGRKRS